MSLVHLMTVSPIDCHPSGWLFLKNDQAKSPSALGAATHGLEGLKNLERQYGTMVYSG